MSILFRNAFIVSPVLFGAALLASSPAIAGEADEVTTVSQLERYSQEGQAANQGDQGSNPTSVAQVTSVSQLADVQPTDWAFQALQSLVERYGCIVGYPDGTYRGNRALSRYEFAAGLNACLDRINELIAAGTADLATKEDLATLQRLQEEFAAELATLRGRVDALEARTTELEENQFSTTTKLFGEAVFAVVDGFGGSSEDGDGDDSQTTFQDRVRLNFVSTFEGDIQLNTRLDAGNGLDNNATLPGDTEEGTFTFQSAADNDVVIGWIGLYFPVGDKLDVYVSPAFPLWQDFVPTVSPFFEGFTGATAALTSFAESSPIYKIGLGEAGGGFNFKITEDFTFSAGYFAGNASDPSEDSGLFNNGYAALAQLTYAPGDKFQVAATYVRSVADVDDFDPFFLLGTSAANDPFDGSDYEANTAGLEAAYQFSPRFSVNIFGMYQFADEFGSGDREAEILSWGAGLALPDLGGEGNLGAVLVGAEPYITDSDSDVDGDEEMPIHVEAFYRYQLNDNISITPGAIVLINPDGDRDQDNETAVIGTIRTTFTF